MSKQLTTAEALKQLMSSEGWYKDLGITFATGNSLASRFRNGKLTLDKQEEILQKAGYIVKQEKLWSK